MVYRNLKVVDAAGKLLLDEPLVLPPDRNAPAGFRVGTRGTRLALALARSPEVPPETPVIVLSHMGDVVREASRRGDSRGPSPATPTAGRCACRSSAPCSPAPPLAPSTTGGVFDFAGPNPRGLTTLYINPGIGMSVLPLRFDCPPRWALIELGRE